MTDISIIIPFYEQIEWTREAIQSILDQTFQDFEIVVVDDGSQRSYESEIRQLDNRILYVRQNHQGPASARNTGIRTSKSDLIAFLDSDDAFLPQKLEIQREEMRRHSAIMLSHTSYCLIDNHETQIALEPSGLFTGRVYPDIYTNCPIATPTVMVRREALMNKAFNEKVYTGEDVLMWAEISRSSEILGIDLPLTKVRIHGQNAAYLPDKRREGLENFVKFGVLTDKEIKKIDRKRVLSTLHFQIGHTYFEQRKFYQGLFYLFTAVVQEPSVARFLIIRLLKRIIPKRIRTDRRSMLD